MLNSIITSVIYEFCCTYEGEDYINQINWLSSFFDFLHLNISALYSGSGLLICGVL